MSRYMTVGISFIAGVALGAAALTSLHAQSKGPGAYVIIDLAQIKDRDSFAKQVLMKAEPVILGEGGKFVTRTEKISALDGSAPQRFVIIAFDNTDKAKAWYTSAAWQEIDAARKKFTTSRLFVADAEGPTP
jgi:uncharacterized protein (DUF1330 family)